MKDVHWQFIASERSGLLIGALVCFLIVGLFLAVVLIAPGF
jgi:hypothetical protein